MFGILCKTFNGRVSCNSKYGNVSFFYWPPFPIISITPKGKVHNSNGQCTISQKCRNAKLSSRIYFLPPYSTFLNSMKERFSVWKYPVQAPDTLQHLICSNGNSIKSQPLPTRHPVGNWPKLIEYHQYSENQPFIVFLSQTSKMRFKSFACFGAFFYYVNVFHWLSQC